MDDAGPQQELIVRGGLCLLPGEGLVSADVVCAGGEIVALRTLGAASGRAIDVHGCSLQMHAQRGTTKVDFSLKTKPVLGCPDASVVSRPI